MKRTLITSLSLALLLSMLSLCAHVSQAQQGATLSTSQPTGKVAEIESFVKELDQYIKANEKSARIFADVSSATEQGTDEWREFKTEQEREKAGTGDNLAQNAFLWMRDGKIAGASFTLQSPSGDWVHYVMYYFRPDGTLAKSDSTLNTFRGDITVIRQDYYNSKGIMLKGTTHCKDLKTQKSRPCGQYEEQPVPSYKNIRELPFYSLLKK
jgi:hypothetical protein